MGILEQITPTTETDPDDEYIDDFAIMRARSRGQGLIKNMDNLKKFQQAQFGKEATASDPQDKKNRQILKQVVEFFEPIKRSTEKSDFFTSLKKGFKQENKLIVTPNEDRADELGQVTYFGWVLKQIRDTDKFHTRWIVLRGCDIYWYRNVTDLVQKDKQTLPAKPILNFKVDGKDCFSVPKIEGADGSRRLVFMSNNETDFEEILKIMTNLRIYIESTIHNRDMIDSVICSYIIERRERTEFMFRDINLHQEYRI